MGQFRSQPDLNKETIINQTPTLRYAVSSMCGWRNYMQDAHIHIPEVGNSKCSLFGVFDGHGGAQVSTFVKRHFKEEFEKNQNLKNETFLRMDELMLTQEGKDQIKKIQIQMHQKENGAPNNDDSHAGCTANVVFITPQKIYCANAGDSRAVACKKGEAMQLSTDHKPQDKKQLERIKRAGGQVSLGRVNGDFEYKLNKQFKVQEQIITSNPDIKAIDREGIEYIIMGCDGIWQQKSNEQMVNWINKKIKEKVDIKAIVEDLLNQLIAKDANVSETGTDNMSTIFIQMK